MTKRELKVFSLNCLLFPFFEWWFESEKSNERVEALIEHLKKSDYDLICLQEVWSEIHRNKIISECRIQYPYSTIFLGGIVGTGLMIVSRWQIESTKYRTFGLNGYYHQLEYWDALAGSGIGHARIRTEDNYLLSVYVSHFHAEYNRTKDTFLADRSVQAMEAGDFIQMTSRDSDVIIFCGDFNTEPGDLPHRILTDVFHLQDPHRMTKLTTYYNKRNTFNKDHLQREISIDYIMHKSGDPKIHQTKISKFELALDSKIPGFSVSYSDHEGLVATVQLENTSDDSPITRQADESVLHEYADILSAEVDVADHWQAIHVNSLLLTTLIFLARCIFGSTSLVLDFGCGFVFIFFIYLVLLYQNRKYALRQNLNAINIKRQKH